MPSIQALDRKARQEQARWQAEEDLRTLRRAEEIRAQAQRLKAAQKVANEELKALERIKRSL